MGEARARKREIKTEMEMEKDTSKALQRVKMILAILRIARKEIEIGLFNRGTDRWTNGRTDERTDTVRCRATQQARFSKEFGRKSYLGLG